MKSDEVSNQVGNVPENTQTQTSIPQQLIEITPQQPAVPTSPLKTKKWLLLLALVVVVILALGTAGFFAYQNSQLRQQSVQIQLPTSTADKIQKANSKWPQVNLSNTVFFMSSKDILGRATPDGKNVQPFNQELTKNYSSVRTWVSPDHNKLLFVLSKGSDEFNYYLASLDGQVTEKINLDKIKRALGSQYEITFRGWSVDSRKLVFIARDVKDFLDSRCCDGGDYRSSKQIVGEYDIETADIKELLSKTQAPLGFLFYDPAQKLIVYTDYQFDFGGVAHLLNLQNNQEIEFKAPNDPYQGGNNQYFVDVDDKEARSLKVYSFYEPTKPITEVTIDEPTNKNFAKWFLWSPNSKYFAILILNSDTTFSDLLKIYDRNGKLMLRTNLYIFDGSVFSSDDRYLLASDPSFKSGTYLTTWEAIEVTTGNHLINPFTSADIGRAFFWFK